MRIVKAKAEMLSDIERIYEEARAFMRESGNSEQWAGGYPPTQIILSDIEEERLHAVIQGEKILAVFYFAIESDPTYMRIFEGEWKNSDEYGVIHRVAVGSAGRGLGISSLIFSYCKERIGNLRIDTHKDNLPMQRALMKNGFEYCGIIYLASGASRLAYHYAPTDNNGLY